MNTYELVLLLNEEKELPNIEQLIITNGGTIEKKEEWGNKRLAYPIKKATSANYYLWTLKLKSGSVQKIRQSLNYNTHIIRFLLLKVEQDK